MEVILPSSEVIFSSLFGSLLGSRSVELSLDDDDFFFPNLGGIVVRGVDH